MNSFTVRTRSPYRYDIVGSFLRPQSLKEARVQYANHEIDASALEEIENQAILSLIHKQESAGLKAITDGEFRRSWWHEDFFWGLNGIQKVALSQGNQFHQTHARPETAQIINKINGENHPFVHHFKFLVANTSKDREARQTIPSPAQLIQELYRPENQKATHHIYPSQDALLEDVSKAYQTVITDLYNAGAKTVQFDDCTWGRLIGGNDYEGLTDKERDYRKALYLEVNNAAIAGKPEALNITTHICRGNYRSTWFAQGGYDYVADSVLAKENVHAFYLEYDSERAGGFEPLRYIPEDKYVVLGLITSKEGTLEDKKTIINRIHEAAQVFPLDHLCISTQCGFSSTEEGNNLTETQQWQKIALVKEIAEEIWGA